MPERPSGRYRSKTATRGRADPGLSLKMIKDHNERRAEDQAPKKGQKGTTDPARPRAASGSGSGGLGLVRQHRLEFNRRAVAQGRVRIQPVVVLLDPRPDCLPLKR